MGRKAKETDRSYIVDESGRTVSVVFPIEEYTELKEDISDLAAVAERRKEESIDPARLIERLKADGLL